MGISTFDFEGALSCQRCPLSVTRTNVVWGETWYNGDEMWFAGPRLFIVGEAPGKSEDLRGRPFVGPAGRLLRVLLAHAGVSRCYITNRVKCNPPGITGGNRRPSAEELDACHPWFQDELDIWNPPVVLLMGITSTRPVFRNKTVGEVVGKSVYKDRVWVATYHPSYILHQRGSDIGKSAEQQILGDIKYAWELVKRS